LTIGNGRPRPPARDLEQRLAEALAQAEHWRSRAEEARIALARVEGEAAAMRLVIDELRSELTWHRRAWWQKLFG
jgi:hypothetical protein